ncbi:MAG: SPFH domain-containing protein [Dehalococcoidia bacterium]
MPFDLPQIAWLTTALTIGIPVLLLIVLIGRPLVNIGGEEVGLVERRYFGAGLPEGRVIAMPGQVGIQARVLRPGLHVLFPYLYRVQKRPMIVIGENEVGIVESIDGNPLAPGHIFARRIGSHDLFQDGEAFLRAGGQKGPQVDVLPPGQYRINTYLFRIRVEPALIVPANQVGVVSARDGEQIEAGRLLASQTAGHNSFQDGEAFLANEGQRGPQIDVILPGRYRLNTDLFSVQVAPATVVGAAMVGQVTAKDGEPLPSGELVAASVTGHTDFQNGSAFLAAGGQRGPQLDLLRPGTYYINPLMFDVTLDDVAVVQRGQVAVLVSNVGPEPDRPQAERLAEGLERYVVPQGFRGIQSEVAGPGVYYLNRWAYLAYVIPTTNLTIDWAEETTIITEQSGPRTQTDEEPEPRRLQLFNPLSVISRDGFEMKVSVKVIMRVHPEQAPLMVAKIGSVQNLIDHVIHPMIDSSFRNQASSTEAMSFMQDRAVEQEKAEVRAREEMEKYHVECVRVLISQIILPEELMHIHTRRVIAMQQQEMFIEQQKSEQQRIATENTRAQADQQINLVSAQIGVQIAEQNRQTTVIGAEGRARAIELEGNAEGSKILAIGNATAEAYDRQQNAIGQANLFGIEIAKSIAGAGLKITPDIVVGGDGGGGMFAAFLAQMLAGGRVPALVGGGNGGSPAAAPDSEMPSN